MITALAIVFISSFAFTSPVTDSLQVEIGKASGLRKIDLRLELAEQYIYAKGDTSMTMANDILAESEKIDYKAGLAGAYSIIGSYYIVNKDYGKARDVLLEGLKAIDGDESLTVTGLLYSKLGDAYSKLGMRDDAIAAMTKSLPLLESSGKMINAGYIANFLGYLYWQKSLFDSSLVYYMKALPIREALGDLKGSSLTSNNIGIIHYQWGNYEQALAYYMKAERLAEDAGDSVNVALFLNNVGITYRDWKKSDEALSYFTRALGISRHIGSSYVIGYSLNNIGTAYEEKGEYESALDYYRQSLDHFTTIGDRRGCMMSFNSLAKLFNRLREAGQAAGYADSALTVARELGSLEHQTVALTNRGVAEMYLKRFDRARRDFDESLRLSYQIGKRDQAKETLSSIADLYRAMGDYHQAYDYYRRFVSLKDSLFNETSARNIDHLKIAYETEKTNRENELLRITAIHQQSTIKRNRTIIMLVSLLLCIIAVSTLVFFRLYIDKRKANAVLEEKNRELSIQRDTIEAREKELEAAFANIKTLSGLLPICANCKKIRDDSGYWSEVESYITRHSDAVFSHGICPDCMKKLYPDFHSRNPM